MATDTPWFVLWAARVRAGAVALVCAFAIAPTAAANAQESPPPPSVLSATAAAPRSVEPEPGPTRLFFAPTARSMPHGKGSIGLTEVAFPWVEAALGDHVSLLGVAVPPLGGLTSAGIVVAPKVQLVRSTRFQAAAGVMQAFGGGQSGGVAYSVATVGGADAAATLGCGFGYGQWADSGGSRAIFFVGFDKRLNRTFRLVGEGWLGGDALGLPDVTLIGALRVGRGGWSVDLGVVVPVYETGRGTPFPLITIARRF